MKYIEATADAGKKFYQTYQGRGKIVMLNLLKFKVKANYNDFANLKPEQEITGKEAYERYMDGTLPELKKAGGKVLFYGTATDFLIGPESEKWDAVLLVEHHSVEKFIQFAKNPDYLEIAGHRNAALEDSRLLPLTGSIDFNG